MVCTLRRWVGLSEGEYYDTKTDPVSPRCPPWSCYEREYGTPGGQRISIGKLCTAAGIKTARVPAPSIGNKSILAWRESDSV
jgi:hypothetical protein